MAGTITHQWNGTILTITSDSGTSSCDLKGEKGDDGARGAMGLPGDANLIDAVAAAEKAAADAETALSQLGTARDEAVAAAAQVKAIVAGNEAYTKAESDNRYANAIKPTVKENIVSIKDAAAYPTVSAITHIEPKQEGSGTASPTNIRPISGWDAASIQRTGKNLLNGNDFANKLVKVSATKNEAAGTIHFYASSMATSPTLLEGIFKPNTQYTVMLYGKASARWTNIAIGYTDGTNEVIQFASANTDMYATKHTAAGKTVKSIFGIYYDGNTTLYYNKCGIFEGILTQEQYEPYNGITLNATLPETIYGGKLDWNTGELTVDKGYVNLGTYDWGYIGDGLFYANINDLIFTRDEMICSQYEHYTGDYYEDMNNYQMWALWHAYAPQNIIIRNRAYTNVADIKTAMNGVMLVYKKTPQTYQLTPQQLETLKGVNNVWSDCGSTEITYVADTKLYIDNKFNELSTALVAMGG